MPPSRRASPDVVQKRRVARQFNDLLLGTGGGAGRLDGRTEKRRQRLLEELREGAARGSGAPLKPIDVLSRVAALIALETPVALIKKMARPARKVAPSDEVVDGIRRLHEAYGFPSEVYAFVGIDDETLKRAGVLGRSAPPPAKAPPAKPGLTKASQSRKRPSARKTEPTRRGKSAA
jgi:hypothetical protein